MPLKNGNLTPQERAFVDAMVRTGDKGYAGVAAGYRQPRDGASHALRNPVIVAEIQAAAAFRLKTEGAQVGVATLLEIAGDKKSPSASRVMAARELVKLSGVASDAEGENKPLHAMSRAELVDAANKARQALAELDAPVIEGETVPAGGVFE